MAFDVPIQKVARKTFYTIHDLAIDKDQSNWEAYQRTQDPKHLTFREEPLPVGFVFEWMDLDDLRKEIRGTTWDDEMKDEAFRVLCVGVENSFETGETTAKGKPILWHPHRLPRPGGVARITDRALKQVPRAIRHDVGNLGLLWLLGVDDDDEDLTEHEGN